MSSKKRKISFPKNFPPDCLRLISLYLPFKDTLNLLTISKTFNEILSDGITWVLRTKQNIDFRKLCFMLQENDAIPKATILKSQTNQKINRYLKKSVFYKNLKDILYITRDKGCFGFTVHMTMQRHINVIDSKEIVTLSNVRFKNPLDSGHFPPKFVDSTARIIIIDKPRILDTTNDVVYISGTTKKVINLRKFVENFINECMVWGSPNVHNIIYTEFRNNGYFFRLNSEDNFFFLFIYWGDEPKKTVYMDRVNNNFPIFFQ